MQQTPEIDIPTVFTHCIKIEQTAKGVRVTVHVNANNGLEAMEQSINLYRATKLQLEQQKEVVAPTTKMKIKIMKKNIFQKFQRCQR